VAGIFISYRREDSAGYAGRLFADLKRRFAQDQIFIDVAGIALGRDFRKVVDEHVSGCDVLLAVIGREWAGVRQDQPPRLQDPKDLVRIEIASALKRDIPVVPVLVEGATMPRQDELPSDLEPLSFRNAIELRHERWDDDVGELMDALAEIIKAQPGSVRPAPAAEPDEDPEVSALFSRLLSAPPLDDLEDINMRAAALRSRRPDDLNVARLSRKAAEALDRERAQVFGSAPVLEPSTTRPRGAGRRWAPLAAALGLALGGILILRTLQPVVVRPSPTPTPTPTPDPPRLPTAIARLATPEATARPTPTPENTPSPPEPTPTSTRPETRTFPMPDVTGRDIKTSTALLERLGLKVTERSVKRYVTPGTVLEQMPLARSPLHEGDEVFLTWARAVPGSMPNLVGLDLRAAMEKIKAAGLVLRNRTSEETKAAPPMTVLRQDPPPGADVRKGAAVEITYAVAPRESGACLEGYVWREAFRGDHVCVTPETRIQARKDNEEARDQGPDAKCAPGSRWRLANETDHVCVTERTWKQTQLDNKRAPTRVAKDDPGPR
jgi:hypothetical protein